MERCYRVLESTEQIEDRQSVDKEQEYAVWLLLLRLASFGGE